MLTEHLTEGTYKISMEDYLADPCLVPSLSRTTIKHLANGVPYRAWHNHCRLNPKYQPDFSSKYDIGTLCHSLLLEGIDIAKVLPFDDWKTNKAKEERDKARKAGKVPMLSKHYDQCIRIVDSVREFLAQSELGIKNLPREGDSELTYIWQEDDTWCRIRPDWVSKDRTIILDTKFTGTIIDTDQFSRQADTLAYDIQDALYSRGVNAVDGTDPEFYFLVTEIEEPYLSCLIGLDQHYKDLGAEKVEYGINLWEQCRAGNSWPKYPNSVCFVGPKPWTVNGWQSKQFRAIPKEEEGFGDET